MNTFQKFNFVLVCYQNNINRLELSLNITKKRHIKIRGIKMSVCTVSITKIYVQPINFKLEIFRERTKIAIQLEIVF